MMRNLLGAVVSIMILVAFIPVLAFAGQNGYGEKGEQNVLSMEESSYSQNVKSETPIDISSMTLALDQTQWVYSGVAVCPDATIDGLINGQDYELSYFDNDRIGTATIIATGIGDYCGETSVSFKIVETTIDTVDCSPGSTIYVGGSFQIYPSITHPSGETTYLSSNNSIAVVSSTGKVTGKKAGTCTITVQNNKKTFDIPVTVNNPRLNKSSVSLRVGYAVTISIIGKTGTASFKSSNTKVATVSSAGVIKAKSKGKCTITVVSSGVTMKCTVTVTKPVLNKKSITVFNSNTFKLNVLGGKGKIKWKSSNKKVATISSKGIVKGKKAGKCTITAKRGKYKMKCKVVVPSHYKGFSIPDFGAKFGKKGKYYCEDGIHAKIYKAKKSYINKYSKVLKKKGFSLFNKSKGTYSYINDSYDFVAFAYEKGRITVVYANLLEQIDWDEE